MKLNSEAFRLELELSKVLRENEELFKTRLGAGAGVKTGASAHLVHSLKRRIKELEGTVTKKEDELKKVRSDTRVTRLAEMEVEKDAYLYEVRRLQKELARIAAVTGGIPGGAGEAGDGTQRETDDLRRKVPSPRCARAAPTLADRPHPCAPARWSCGAGGGACRAAFHPSAHRRTCMPAPSSASARPGRSPPLPGTLSCSPCRSAPKRAALEQRPGRRAHLEGSRTGGPSEPAREQPPVRLSRRSERARNVCVGAGAGGGGGRWDGC